MESIESIIESFKENNPMEIPSKSRYAFEGFICPYFVPDEVEQFKGYYSDKVNEECVELYEHMMAHMHHRNKIEKSWFTKVNELQLKLKQAIEPEEIDQIKQDLITLGWNPEVEYNAENQILAKNRFETIINEKYSFMKVIDVTHLLESEEYNILEESKKNNLHPIHIVNVEGISPLGVAIKAYTKDEFTHSAMALDNNFKKLYSYNFMNKINPLGGFSLESYEEYNKEARFSVYTFFVTSDVYIKINAYVQNLLNNIKGTTYSLVNLITFPFKLTFEKKDDNMICSQFVDFIAKMSGNDFTGVDSSKVSPGKMYLSVKNNPKAYKVFDGYVKDFNEKKIVRYVENLTRKVNSKSVSESVFIEKALPIEIKNNGDVLLTNPFPNFNDEYFNSHRLLLNYEKTGNIEGMKYELARLYYMNYILERKLYHNKMLHNKEENMKIRARILNDFNKYHKYICKKDKKFNFSKYYEQSPFYPYTTEIKASTIGRLINIISYIS